MSIFGIRDTDVGWGEERPRHRAVVAGVCPRIGDTSRKIVVASLHTAREEGVPMLIVLRTDPQDRGPAGMVAINPAHVAAVYPIQDGRDSCKVLIAGATEHLITLWEPMSAVVHELDLALKDLRD